MKLFINKTNFALIAFFSLIAMQAKAVTPCPPHAGQPYPWEGSGACTGNVLLSIPLPTTGLELYYNTETNTGNFGYGTAAWRLSVDARLRNPSGSYTVNTGDPAILVEAGDGSQTPFQTSTIKNWKSSKLVLSRAKLAYDTSTFTYETREHDKITFTPIVFGGVSLNWFARTYYGTTPNQTLTINRQQSGFVSEIVLPFSTRKIRFNVQNNRTESIQDLAGQTYTLRYDSAGRLSSVEYPDATGWAMEYQGTSNLVSKIYNTSGESTELTYVSTDGVIRSVATEKGYRTVYTYTNDQVEVANQIDKLTERFNERHALIQSDRAGLVSEYVVNTNNLPTLATMPLGTTLIFEYDERLNLKSAQDENGIVTTYTYDERDNATKIKVGPLTTVYAYDAMDRVVTIITPDGRTLTLTRNAMGLITEVKDGNTIIARALYDSRGQMYASFDRGGKQQAYGYIDGLLSSHTDKLGRTTSVKRNSLGLPIQIVQPSGVTRNIAYDSMGRVTDSTLSNGKGKSLGVTISRVGGGVAANLKKKKVKLAAVGGVGGSSNTNPSTTTTPKVDGTLGIPVKQSGNGETSVNDITTSTCGTNGKGCANLEDKSDPEPPASGECKWVGEDGEWKDELHGFTFTKLTAICPCGTFLVEETSREPLCVLENGYYRGVVLKHKFYPRPNAKCEMNNPVTTEANSIIAYIGSRSEGSFPYPGPCPWAQ